MCLSPLLFCNWALAKVVQSEDAKCLLSVRQGLQSRKLEYGSVNLRSGVSLLGKDLQVGTECQRQTVSQSVSQSVTESECECPGSGGGRSQNAQ